MPETQPQDVKILDPGKKVVATGKVTDHGLYFAGSVDLSATPAELTAIFKEWESSVNEQLFSRLDEIESKIEAFGLRSQFDRSEPLPICDLQVYPSTKSFAFRRAEDAAIKPG